MKKKQFRLAKYPFVQVKQFSFAYETLEKPLLRKIDFDLDQGEVSLLVGASGSGKSSLSLCLSGLYPQLIEGFTEGSILLSGKDIKSYQAGEINQKIGIIFQDPESQFCMIHVVDELAFTLENLHIPKEEMEDKIDTVLQLVGMTSYKYRKLHELSGGEKQKIALAAVLLLEPEFLILDEATVNLDPVSTVAFVRLIKKIQKERELTILIIDHQADEWLPMLDRVLLISKQGELIANDKAHKVFTEKRDLFKKEGVFLPRQYEAWTYVDLIGKYISLQEPSTILEVEHIAYERRDKSVLKDIHFQLKEGSFVSIVGKNGSGKSTLLEIIAGLLTPKHGKVYFQKEDMDQWREKELREKMGYVFQNPEHQFITDTVYDELAFSMKLNGKSHEQMDISVKYLMDQFGLDNHSFQNPFSLSGGQKRRLSVATALDETPDIILMDEPTFGQDAHTTKRLMEFIFTLKEMGVTIVFVTHDMNLAAISDQIFVIDDGVIAYQGIPEKLWQNDDLLERAHLRLPFTRKMVKENREMLL